MYESHPRLYDRVRGSRTIALTVAAMLVLLTLWTCQPQQPQTPAGPPSKAETVANPYVRGFIATIPATRGAQDRTAASRAGPVGIYLPDVAVMLRDASSNRDVARAKTDLSGRYNFARVANGRYMVCWQMRGFSDGCGAPFDLAGQPMRHPIVHLQPDLRRYPLQLHGSVRLRDGAIRLFEPFANLNVFGRVRAHAASGAVIDSAIVNTFGGYVLPLRTNRDNIRLEGIVENMREVATLSGEMLRRAGASHQADLILNNNRPRPHLLTQAGGRNVRAAAPGSTVQLRAAGQDIDGDALRFHWILPENAGSLSASTGASVSWQLPGARGTHRVQLLVSDGKGGYARTEARITTEANGLRFGGRVNATDAPAVAGAEIEINGARTQTDANGRFLVSVPDTSRYVVNITKPGYNLVSRVYTEPITGGQWQLTRGTTVSVNPTRTIDVTDARKSQRCAGPVSTRLRWREYPEAAKTRIIDPRNGRVALTRNTPPRELRDQPRDGGCGPGARIQIPANALVDGNGNAPSGNVDVTIFTVDPNSPDDMPGDYTAFDRQGRARVMESWGAAEVTIRAGNVEYNLKSGDSATLTIPIDPAQLAASGADPAVIPLLRYEKKRGAWEEIGRMSKTGNRYVAKVGHFTPFNADLLKTDQSCIQVHTPPSSSDFAGLPASYRIEFTIPLEDNAPRRIDRAATNSPPYNVLINLPNNRDVIMVPYNPSNLKPYGTFIVNSGGTQNPVAPNPPDYDFGACQAAVTLYDVSEPELGPDAFLHGLYSFESANLDELSEADATVWANATNDYYDQVDPRNLRRSLTDFRTRNGFPANETRVIYANSADLGFGRDMHCVRNAASDGGADDVACYVSNYGDINTDDTQDFADAVQNNGLVATVAMEYSRIENDNGAATEFTDPDRVVKFFVYGANGGIVTAADLDGRGARPIPQLCLVCHGGSTGGTGVAAFPDRQSVKLGSKFIAFDLAAYTIVDGIDPAFNKAAQQANFKTLNNNIVKATNPGAPIVELIDSMYLNGVLDQREGFSIVGWNGNGARKALYQNVVGPSCRMCHASQPQTNIAGIDIRFTAAQQFIDIGNAVAARVCTEHVMPHAFATHDTLWGSIGPHQPAELISFASTQMPGVNMSACGAPPAVPPTPTAPTYDGQMGAFFQTRCASCHAGPKAPVAQNDACTDGFTVMASLLDLTTANGYNGIINQTSVEAPPMKLVTPGDLAQSYLWHKVNNSHLGAPVNGCGVRMPLGAALNSSELQQISDWITGGALKN